MILIIIRGLGQWKTFCTKTFFLFFRNTYSLKMKKRKKSRMTTPKSRNCTKEGISWPHSASLSSTTCCPRRLRRRSSSTTWCSTTITVIIICFDNVFCGTTWWCHMNVRLEVEKWIQDTLSNCYTLTEIRLIALNKWWEYKRYTRVYECAPFKDRFIVTKSGRKLSLASGFY